MSWGLGLVGSAARLRCPQRCWRRAPSADTFPTAVEMAISWSFSRYAARDWSRWRRSAWPRPAQACYTAISWPATGSMLPPGWRESIRPALVVCGEDDRMTPPRRSTFLSDGHPRRPAGDHPRRRAHGDAGKPAGSCRRNPCRISLTGSATVECKF